MKRASTHLWAGTSHLTCLQGEGGPKRHPPTNPHPVQAHMERTCNNFHAPPKACMNGTKGEHWTHVPPTFVPYNLHHYPLPNFLAY